MIGRMRAKLINFHDPKYHKYLVIIFSVYPLCSLCLYGKIIKVEFYDWCIT